MKHQHKSISDAIRPSLKEMGRWQYGFHQLHDHIALRRASKLESKETPLIGE